MNQKDYIKQLEASNQLLQEKLDDALNIVDTIQVNPFQTSMILLIDSCLKHQARMLSVGVKFSGVYDLTELRISTPRQIGLTTCIVNACEHFFDTVHVLNTTVNISNTNTNTTHKSVTSIPNGVSCIIVDPWSLKYSEQTIWYPIKQKLGNKFDNSKPFLLVLAG